ncbi:MAG TPA: hypothetical protein VIM11_22050 [Tepidisphaeraceae bacterium]|jgi:hypothetical protein
MRRVTARAYRRWRDRTAHFGIVLLSVLVAAACGLLLIQSYQYPRLWVERRTGGLVAVSSFHGGLRLMWHTPRAGVIVEQVAPTPSGWDVYYTDPPSAPSPDQPATIVTYSGGVVTLQMKSYLGLAWSCWRPTSPDQSGGAKEVIAAITLPYWVPLLVSCALAVLGGKRAHAHHKRLRMLDGRCTRCGYDLRATTERCPECGTPIPPPMHAP